MKEEEWRKQLQHLVQSNSKTLDLSGLNLEDQDIHILASLEVTQEINTLILPLKSNISTKAINALINCKNFSKLNKLDLNPKYTEEELSEEEIGKAADNYFNFLVDANKSGIRPTMDELGDGLEIPDKLEKAPNRLDCVKAIANSAFLSNLTHLNLNELKMGNDGAKALSESRFLSKLQCLELNGNWINDNGARAIAESKYFGNLTKISLVGNKIGDSGAHAIVNSSALLNLKEINFSGNKAMGAYKYALTNLQSLSAYYRQNSTTKNSLLTEKLAQLLKTKNTKLNFANQNIADEDIYQLILVLKANEEFANYFTSLDLKNNQIGDEGIFTLTASSQFKSLTRLYLEENHISEQGAIAISRSPHLSSLNKLCLSKNNINEEGVIALASSSLLKSLTHLSLSTNNIGEKGAQAIASSSYLTALTNLYIRDNKIGINGVIALATSKNFANLKYLYIGRNQIANEGAIAIAENPLFSGLSHLVLNENLIGDKGAVALAKSPYLSSLTKLNLGGGGDTKIGKKGASAIANNPRFTKLTELFLDGNEIDYEGAMVLATSQHLKSLSKLDISSNKIGDKGAISLAKSPYLKSLADLSLDSNKISDTGVRSLSLSQTLESLTSLSLFDNNIGSKGALAISNGGYYSLSTLVLGMNNIGDEGTIALANSQKSSSLIQLILNKNKIGDQGARAIADSPHLTSLIHLNLKENQISDEGAKLLIGSKYLASLKTLKLSQNHSISAPSEFLDDLESLRAHYQIVEYEKEVVNDQLTVFILGRYHAGKTTFVNKLIDPNYHQEEDTRTLGFDEHHLTFPVTNHPDKINEINLRFLDFGGQLIQQYCHGFFLSEFGVYLLIIDSQTESSELEEWLNIIDHYGYDKTNPTFVIPVINFRSGEKPEEMREKLNISENEKKYRLKFYTPLIINIMSAEFHDGCVTHFTRLFSDFRLKPLFPSVKLADQIIYRWNINYLSEREFYKRIEETTLYADFLEKTSGAKIRVSEKGFMDMILVYLGQLGVFHHFKSQRLIVLKKNWLQKGLYALLSPDDSVAEQTSNRHQSIAKLRRNLIVKKGLFSKHQLFEAWNNLMADEYEHEDLLRLMLPANDTRGLNLIYPTNVDNHYLCPPYLEYWEIPHSGDSVYPENRIPIEYIKNRIQSSDISRMIFCRYLPLATTLQHAVSHHVDLAVDKNNKHQIWRNRYVLRIDGSVEIEIIRSIRMVWLFIRSDYRLLNFHIKAVDKIVNELKLLAENRNNESSIVKIPCQKCVDRAKSIAMIGFYHFDDMADLKDGVLVCRSLENLNSDTALESGSCTSSIDTLTFGQDRHHSSASTKSVFKSMRVLYLASNPTDVSALDLENELRDLKQEIHSVTYRSEILLTAEHAIRPDDLLRHVRNHQPNVIHFSGHGTEKGIVLRDDSGGYKEVGGIALQRFFKGRGIDLVILNSCYSKYQANLIKDSVKAVIGTSDAIEDEAGRRFTTAFYRALGEGLSVGEAFRDGGDAVALNEFTDFFLCFGDRNLTFVNK